MPGLVDWWGEKGRRSGMRAARARWGAGPSTRLLMLAGAAAVLPGGGRAADTCAGPHADQLGPLYLAGAPHRVGGVVCAPRAGDLAITVSGTVRTADCAGVVPFAVLDVWQTSSDADGAHYYGCAACTGDAAKHADGGFYCRGKVTAGADGSFAFQTVRPGRYDARPVVHVHVKVLTADEPAGGPEHVTQLYFADDDRSSAQPASARMSVATDGTAAIDIATPFAGAAATSEAASPPSSASPAPAVLPEGLTAVAPALSAGGDSSSTPAPIPGPSSAAADAVSSAAGTVAARGGRGAGADALALQQLLALLVAAGASVGCAAPW